ncbi:aryl-alcohol dehydrogenase-like predicted oxidoreductase [Terracoccus luteus]|uniref:Aryl-alcohol dehydrogenase-like predicted oxidoreductase n=2 Tax=Terracoccus luteus TaxID=53356 RepID=A0A839PTN9_9MICO|nr:aryl-alcohol dehydrogenase-like predicted oxidoreductase [Terracoccus luteus]MCP2171998.1 aryl-alcohol dehydrogenase-like predicted oxidoreductase [Terracoccus luteus]
MTTTMTGGHMQQRVLGRTGAEVSVVGLGTWQLGADWGEVSDADALAVLEASADAGVTFFDTADVYGDGRSEQLIGRFLAGRGGPASGITVATKMGRRVDQVAENYTAENFRAWTERSRRNLGVDTLDLVQLHCPPSDVFTDDAVFEALDELVASGAVRHYGVSVETVDQALTAIARPNVATVQIIVNAFRLKPVDEVLPVAVEAGVGIIARVPLASGLLTGKYDLDTTFAADDHRSYNRDGSAFDVGETFSGVDFETGVRASREFADLVSAEAPEGTTPAQAAIAWLAQQPQVSSVIPGARNVEQARGNAAAGEIDALGTGFDDGVRRIYDEHLRESIHPRW